MFNKEKEFKLFTGNSNPKLAQEIADILGKPMGRATVKTFSDGEVSVSIEESVRGCEVFVIQSLSFPTNDNIMELLIMVDALKRASAAHITAVIPYFGYARQDRKAKDRDPISARLMANLLETAGVQEVLTMDLHAAQIQGFFNIPVDDLRGVSILAPYFRDRFGEKPDDLVVVAPDHGSVKRVRKFIKTVDAPLVILDKVRPDANISEVKEIIGNDDDKIRGKSVLIVDDMVDTAGTLCGAAQKLIDVGAAKVYACASHGVLSGPAMKRLDNSTISELIVLDTIALPKTASKKVKALSSAGIFAEAIKRMYEGGSLSEL